MKRLAVLAFTAGAVLTTSSVAFAQYYEKPRYEAPRQHYVECPHGYKVYHGKCVEIVVRQHCEDGYTWRDGYCRPVYRKKYNSY
jgi:hypothetical protein